MQLLYGLTLASVAFALALSLPMLLPPRETPPLGVAHAQSTVAATPATLCGNIFDGSGSLCGPHRAAPEDTIVASDELVKCDALTLLGIVRDGHAADRAIFAGEGVVKRGEDTGSGYSLVEVYADRTVLARGDLRCELTLFDAPDSGNESSSTNLSPPPPNSSGGFPSLAGRVQVPRAVLDGASPTSLAGVSAIPTRGGIRLRGIAPTSLPARLGLRSGDLVVQVDGQPLTPDSALQLAARLSGLQRISAQVRRGGELITLHADVVD